MLALLIAGVLATAFTATFGVLAGAYARSGREYFHCSPTLNPVMDKDARDFWILIHDHTLTADDVGMHVTRVSEFCARDWGLWRTVTGTLQTLGDAPGPEGGAPDTRSTVRIDSVSPWRSSRAAPRAGSGSCAAPWGDRVQWYVLPETPNEAIDLPGAR